MIYYGSLTVIFAVVLTGMASPIGEISVSYGVSGSSGSGNAVVSDPTSENSVYSEEFADVSSGYKKDEALKVSWAVKVLFDLVF